MISFPSKPEPPSKPVFIFLCIGKNYWPHAAVTILSMLRYTDDVVVNLYFESDNRRWRRKIEQLFADRSARINFIPFDTSLADGLKSCGHLGLSAYFRLFVPELLPKEIDRAIYLDSDLIVRGPIAELHRLPLEGAVLAAAPLLTRTANAAEAMRVGHSEDHHYFNSGVLLIDPHKWRNFEVKERCLAFLRQHPQRVLYADQDLLNACLDRQWVPLPCRWNMIMEAFTPILASDLHPSISPDELHQAQQNPMVVHFNGMFKPWHFRYKHPYKAEYVMLRQKLHRLPYISDDLVKLSAILFRRALRTLTR